MFELARFVYPQAPRRLADDPLRTVGTDVPGGADQQLRVVLRRGEPAAPLALAAAQIGRLHTDAVQPPPRVHQEVQHPPLPVPGQVAEGAHRVPVSRGDAWHLRDHLIETP